MSAPAPTRRLGRSSTPVRVAALALALLLGFAILASLLVGARLISIEELLAFTRGAAGADVVALLVDFRVPRTALAIAVGASLAVAGTVMQAFTRNPLADPGILGVNAGASLAVVLAVWLLGVSTTSDLLWAALAGAGIATLAVVALGSLGRGPSTPIRMTLAGIALAAVLGGVTASIRLLHPETFDRFRVWAAGSLTGRSLADLGAVLPAMIVGLVLALAIARSLNAVSMGEDVATSLGTRVRATRLLALACITLLAGAATAVAGPIAFVGLMVPHLVRTFVGPDNTVIVPLGILAGAALLLVSDIAARLLLFGRDLPVGVVTAFVGAPLLIILVRRARVSEL